MPEPVSETESILLNMKKLLNIPSDYSAFDTDIITHINSYIAVLRSLGLGKKGVKVTDASTTWTDLLGTLESRTAAAGEYADTLDEVPSWMSIKLRLIFDPPVNSFVVTELQELAKELEFHMYMAGEYMRIKAPNYWEE